MSIARKCAAEFIGTFFLVLCGCGSAVLAAAFPDVGIGLVGVSFAFGLTVLAMAYTVGHVSGCHINPAVSIGLLVAKRFPRQDLIPYLIAQVAGAVTGGGVLYLIASGKPGFTAGDFASNGFGAHSPGGYSMFAGFVTEFVFTAMLVLVVLGSTDKRAPAGLAPIAIGLTVTLILLVGIPVTNLSINPARSTGAAVIAGGWALGQLWFFWVVPILGGITGALIYNFIGSEKT